MWKRSFGGYKLAVVWDKTLEIRRTLCSLNTSPPEDSFRVHLHGLLLKSLERRAVGSLEMRSAIVNRMISSLMKRSSSMESIEDRVKKKKLHEDGSTLAHWLEHIADAESVENGCIDVAEVLQHMKTLRKKGGETFRNITDHHHQIKSFSWQATTQNLDSLNRYAVAAQEMGLRPWVANGNRWIVRSIKSFFRDDGARRQFIKESMKSVNTNSPEWSSVGDIRSWIRSVAPLTGVQSTDSLQVLDVGSCYNPLESISETEQVDLNITAIDLCPSSDHAASVMQCDFLALKVGPQDSYPVVTPPPCEGEAVRLDRLPAHHFHAISMSLVLSYLPSPVERRSMIGKAHQLLIKPREPPPLSPFFPTRIPADCLQYGLLLIVEPYSVVKKGMGQWIGAVPSEESSHLTRAESNLKQFVAEIKSMGFEKVHVEPLVHRCSYSTHKRKAIAMAFRATSRGDVCGGMPKRSYSSAAGGGRGGRAPIAIVGCGIGGAALARKLQREGVPYLVFERDAQISSRKQGYALTIQQGLAALRDLGVSADGMRYVDREEDKECEGSIDKSSVKGCTATHSHVSLTASGRVVGVYGAPSPVFSLPSLRLLGLDCDSHVGEAYSDSGSGGYEEDSSRSPIHVKGGRKNVHMPRQALREALMEGLHPHCLMWNHRLTEVSSSEGEQKEHLLLSFENGRRYEVSGVVGADGIYSSVRDICIAPSLAISKLKPDKLTYLGLVVILGIAPTQIYHNVHTEVDSWTMGSMSTMCRKALIESSGGSISRRKVQWLDGTSRVFSMPYDEKYVMWQLSFPMDIADICQITGAGKAQHTYAGFRRRK